MLIQTILGIIQGIFEWLPISSQAILALVSQWLIEDFNPMEVALFLHLGTFFAVLVYFHQDWKKVLFFQDKNLLQFLIIATAVSLILGFFLFNIIIITNIAIGNSLLFLTGFGLLFTAFFQNNKKIFKIETKWLAVIVGLLQGLSVIPGLSRSAATIFGLSLGKKEPSEILKISYMMSAPVVLASTAFLFLKNPVILSEFWISLVISFLVGLLSLKILFQILTKINFYKFAIIFSLLCFLGGIIGIL